MTRLRSGRKTSTGPFDGSIHNGGRRALVAAFGVPTHDRDSGSLRVRHLIQFLAEAGWTVTFLAASGVRSGRYVRELEQTGVPVHDGRKESVEELCTAARFDMALLVYWQVAELYVPLIRRASPATRILVDSVDLQFIRNARRLFLTAPNPEIGALDSDYAGEASGEINVYGAVDGVLTVSEKETDLVNSFVGDPLCAHTVPDYEELSSSAYRFRERSGSLFVGSFRHVPNADALAYLCDEIVPHLDPSLLNEHPIYVVGDGLSAAIRAKAGSIAGIRLIGWVPSLVPYYQKARIAIVPLRYGAGTKRKLVHALMAGTPTVTSAVGAEGLPVRDGKETLLADDADAFAAAMTTLLTSERLSQRLARGGREAVSSIHSREAVRTRLTAAIDGVFTKPSSRTSLDEGGWPRYIDRIRYQERQLLRTEILAALSRVAPDNVSVAVATDDRKLLELGNHQAFPFPYENTGGTRLRLPADTAAALSELDVIRARGARLLVFPSTSFWWLEKHSDFAQQAAHRCAVLASDDTYVLYDLDPNDGTSAPVGATMGAVPREASAPLR